MPVNPHTPLYEAILYTFNLEELKDLCFRLGINYDHLAGDTLPAKTRELLQHLERINRLPELLANLRQLRPQTDWERYHPAEPDAVSPFKGLHYFDESDTHLFFGREQLTAELARLLDRIAAK